MFWLEMYGVSADAQIAGMDRLGGPYGTVVDAERTAIASKGDSFSFGKATHYRVKDEWNKIVRENRL